jgi:hypothetical protein
MADPEGWSTLIKAGSAVGGPHEAAAGQHAYLAGKFQLQQRGLQGRVLHLGARGENFKRGGRVAERCEESLRF